MLSFDLLTCGLFVISTFLISKTLEKKHYWIALLVTSVLFYALIASLSLIVIFYLSIVIYLFSFRIENSNKINWVAYILLIMPLLFKKVYFSDYQFYISNTKENIENGLFNLIGLSYITFNGISYLIDIKRKYLKPESNYFKVLFFLIFFPIISSGPLYRAKYFFNEIKNLDINENSIINGLRLILWGVFKNLVISSRIFIVFDTLNQMQLSGIYLLIKGYVFFIFLYISFSSYISIFQGIAKLFNFNVPNNFKNRIYFASNRQFFWSGWHITLNQWFRDYVFYEIVKYDKKKRYTNLILGFTFVLVALWHDFTLAFFVWGILNAFWLIFERKVFHFFGIIKPKAMFFGIIYHSFFVSIMALIFITSDLTQLFHNLISSSLDGFSGKVFFTMNTAIVIITFLIMDTFERKMEDLRFDEYLSKKAVTKRFSIYYLLLFIIIFFGISSLFENYYNHF